MIALLSVSLVDETSLWSILAEAAEAAEALPEPLRPRSSSAEAVLEISRGREIIEAASKSS
jgi:hypothetical protein